MGFRCNAFDHYLGAMKYDSNAKHTYGRGWAINRLIPRLPVPVRDAVIVTLAGEGRDRDWLLKRGIRNTNIISVDRDETAIELVRKNGGLAVHAPIHEFLVSLPDDFPVHGLILDFNCGLDPGVTELWWVLFSPAIHPNAAVYVNLQRGRDWLGRLETRRDKNRAAAFCAGLVQGGLNKTGQAYEFACRRMEIELAKPYRQRDGGVLMDGAVFNMGNLGRLQLGSVPTLPFFGPTRRKIAALRAVRTRKAAA
jgi:hypothetical protein